MTKKQKRRKEALKMLNGLLAMVFLFLTITMMLPEAPRSVVQVPRASLSLAQALPRVNERIEPSKGLIKTQSNFTNGSNGLPSQSEKDATAVACAEAWNRHGKEMKKTSRASYMTTCYNDLLALAYHESGFDVNRENINAREQSFGPFQLNLLAHKDITKDQAKDFVFAVNWTIERLHSYGYPKNRTYALQCHQGCGAKTGYVKNVKATASRFLAMGL